jgi:hypothetical protein
LLADAGPPPSTGCRACVVRAVQADLALIGGVVSSVGEAVTLVSLNFTGRQLVPLGGLAVVDQAGAALAGLQIDLSLGCVPLVGAAALPLRH